MKITLRQWAIYSEGDDSNSIGLFTTPDCPEPEAIAIAIATYSAKRVFRIVDEGTFVQEVS